MRSTGATPWRPTMFVQQLDWLRNHGYHFVTVDDVLADEAGRRPLPGKAVLLTFDDGYKSMYEHAWPVLKEWKIPSLVAVVGSWEDDSRQVDFDGKIIPRQKLMSWKELRQLADSGLVEIGSHSFDLHRGIAGNPQGNMQPAGITRRWLGAGQGYETEAAYRKRVETDLARSSADIQAHIGRAPRVIAWPYGRYNRELHEAAVKHGMTIGLTLDDGPNQAGTPLWRLRPRAGGCFDGPRGAGARDPGPQPGHHRQRPAAEGHAGGPGLHLRRRSRAAGEEPRPPARPHPVPQREHGVPAGLRRPGWRWHCERRVFPQPPHAHARRSLRSRRLADPHAHAGAAAVCVDAAAGLGPAGH